MSKLHALRPRRQSRLLATSSGIAVAASLSLASPAMAQAPDLDVAVNTTIRPSDGQPVEAGAVRVSAPALFQVINGGWLKAATASIGSTPDAREAFVRISGPGSRFEVFGPFVVGEQGAASVMLENGAILSLRDGEGVLTLGGGADGRLVIGDLGSSGTAVPGQVLASEIKAGLAGGQLVFNHNAEDYVFAPALQGNIVIQTRAGRTILTGDSTVSRPVVVDGGELGVEGRLEVLNQDVRVGAYDNSNGALSVRAGGVLVARTMSVGASSLSEGRLNVTGRGSNATVIDLLIGGGGKGLVRVEDLGSIDAQRIMVDSSAQAGLDVEGLGAFTQAHNFMIGAAANGSLRIKDGAGMSSEYLTFGVDAGGHGTGSISGAASSARGFILNVGQAGRGELFVSDGARITSGYAQIGSHNGSIGQMAVVGAGSEFLNEHDLLIGVGGMGALDVSDKAYASSQAVAVGQLSASSGSLSVTGGARIDARQEASVGFQGSGRLTVGDGGIFSVASGAGTLSVAYDEDSIGVISIGGAVDGCCDFAPPTSAGKLDVAKIAFGRGYGRLAFNHTERDYHFDAELLGSGRMEVLAGTTRLTADSHSFDGVVRVGVPRPLPDLVGHGRSVFAPHLIVDGSISADVAVDGGAILSGAGRIGGEVSMFGGATLRGLQGQTLTMGGLWLDRAAVIDVTLGASGTPALFNVETDLTLAGRLNVTAGMNFGEGVHALFTYGGDLNDDLGLTFGSSPHGYDLQLQTATPGQVNLAASRGAELLFWDGGDTARHGDGKIDGGDGLWSVDGANWTSADGLTAGAMQPQPGFAVFQGAAGLVTVDGSGGQVAATGLQFAVDGYRLTGSSLYLTREDSLVRVGMGGAQDAAIRAVIASALVGSGGMIKADGGTLTLTGHSDYAGPTKVEGGALIVDGSITSGATVKANASLGGKGRIGGAVVIEDDGSLEGVQGETLSMGALALNNHSQVNVSLGQESDQALFAIDGDLTLDGVLNVTDVGGFGPGVYALMTYGGSLTDRGLAFGRMPQGVSSSDLAVQTSVAGQINLISDAGADLLFWDGGDASLHGDGHVDGGTGSWSATGANWTGFNGAATAAMRPNPGFSIFQNAGGEVTVDRSAGAIGVTGMQFAADGYQIRGDAVDLTNAETIIRVGDGTAAGADMTATIKSILSGVGGLVKTDLGTLILTGANTYDGDTSVRAGVLIGDAASIRGNLKNDGHVVFDQTMNATFAGNISGLGDQRKTGNGVLTLTGRSMSKWTVEDGGLVSASDRFSGDLQIDAGASFTFDQAQNGVYSGRLTGSGDLRFSGGGQVTLTGASGDYTGHTTIADGILKVSGTMGGSLDVLEGARLMGNGRVGSTRVAGTLAPGASIGKLTVDGDLTFTATGRYEVEIAPDGRADRIDVTGKAVLEGGAVVALSSGQDYVAGTVYRVLDAAGGLNGTFASLTEDLAFLDGRLAYDATGVNLILERNGVGFVEVSRTRNQRAVAPRLEALGQGNPIYDRAVTLSADDARFAYDQLSGEGYASLRSALIDSGRQVASVMVAGSREAANSGGLWGRTYHQGAKVSGDENATGHDHALTGMIAGGDRRVADRLRVGVAAGYDRLDIDARGLSAEVESTRLGGYVAGHAGPVEVTGGLAHSWNRIDADRTVNFNGFAEKLRGDHHNRLFQAFATASMSYETGRFNLTPFVGLSHVTLSGDTFAETGGDAALKVLNRSAAVTFAELGMRGEAVVEARLDVFGSAALRGAWGDRDGMTKSAFAMGQAFEIEGAPIDEVSAMIELGAQYKLREGVTVIGGYVGDFAEDRQSHGAQITARWSF